MKSLSAAYKTFLAQPYQTLAMLVRLTRADGTVIGMTTHDQDIAFTRTWAANTAFNVTATIAVGGTAFFALIGGTSGSGTPDWSSAPNYGDQIIDGGITWVNDGTTCTYSAAAGGSLSDNQNTGTLAANNSELRGPLVGYAITEADIIAGVWDFSVIRISMVNWADLTMGEYRQMDGWTGEFSTTLNSWTVELRGLAQALMRTIIDQCTPLCRYNLGDSRCTVNLDPFTVTGTLTGVSPDNTTMYDSSRTEPGPGGGVSITGISNSNPGIVSLASALDAANGLGIVIAGIVGPSLLNGVTIVRNLAGDMKSFSLGIDTTDTTIYPPYISGGTVTPLGGTSGYFDYGLFTATSGASIGRSMEVKAYVPGQWTLQLPMPLQMAIGDAYTMIAGCDKTIETCNAKYANQLNHGGEPYVPGQDKLSQVGRHT